MQRYWRNTDSSPFLFSFCFWALAQKRKREVGLEFSVSGMVKSVLEEAFKLYHKQGYRTQWCWYYEGSIEADCFDIIWKEN